MHHHNYEITTKKSAKPLNNEVQPYYQTLDEVDKVGHSSY